MPDAYNLRKAGQAWWKWAWGLPQAHAWDSGALYTLARRAQLEDDLEILDAFDPYAIEDLLGISDPNEALQQLGFVIGRLKSLAGGRLAVLKEMRELDGKLGLNPKALAELRWTIVADPTDKSVAASAPPSKRSKSKPAAGSSRRARLSVVA